MTNVNDDTMTAVDPEYVIQWCDQAESTYEEDAEVVFDVFPDAIRLLRECAENILQLKASFPFVDFGRLKTGEWFKWSTKKGAPMYQKVTPRRQEVGYAGCNARIKGEQPYVVVEDDEQVIPVPAPDWKEW